MPSEIEQERRRYLWNEGVKITSSFFSNLSLGIVAAAFFKPVIENAPGPGARLALVEWYWLGGSVILFWGSICVMGFMQLKREEVRRA